MNLDGDKLALLEYKVTSAENRKFKSFSELAHSLGVSERTLYKWQNTADFKAAYITAALAYAEERIPKALDALFANAQQPGGHHDRKTIVHDLLPQIRKARQDKEFDKLIPAGASNYDEESILTEMSTYTQAEQEKFLRLLGKLGAVKGLDTGDDEDEEEVYTVRVDDLDSTPPPQLTSGPGRPRGSRKVRLKRPVEPE